MNPTTYELCRQAEALGAKLAPVELADVPVYVLPQSLHETKFAQWPSKIEKLEQRAEHRKEKADALEPELAEVHAAIAELNKREKELREQMLEP